MSPQPFPRPNPSGPSPYGSSFRSLHPKPLNSILAEFGQDEAWREQRLFQGLRSRWESIVGEAVAAHSRPTGIHRQVLQVATSSSVWAQNLSFERRRILQKIERLAPLRSLPLRDIRFSTAEWYNTSIEPRDRLESELQQRLWQHHPCRLKQQEPPKKCPRCHCLTPLGELARWSICAFCMAEQWTAEFEKTQAIRG